MEINEHPDVTLHPYPNNPAVCAASNDGRYLASAVGSSWVHVFEADTHGSTIAKCHTAEDAARFIQKLLDAESAKFEQESEREWYNPGLTGPYDEERGARRGL